MPTVGALDIDALTALHVQRAVSRWWKEPREDGKPGAVSARTVAYAYRVLHMAMKQAVRWQLVPRNVVELVEAPSVQPTEATWWTADQAAQFLAVAQDHLFGIVFALALQTGMRKGELLGLQWSDIDWDKQLLVVRHVQDSRNATEFGPPKTTRSARAISLDPYLLDLLKSHQTAQRRLQLAMGPAYQNVHNLVCVTGIGTPISPRNLTRDFNKLIAKAGVPRIRFHDLRHTHASLLREQGADIRVIADRLGHTQVHFTAQVYAHAPTQAQAQPALRLAEQLQRKAPPSSAAHRE